MIKKANEMNIKEMLLLSSKILNELPEKAQKNHITPEAFNNHLEEELITAVESKMPKNMAGTYEADLTIAISKIIAYMVKENLTPDTLALAGRQSDQVIRNAIDYL